MFIKLNHSKCFIFKKLMIKVAFLILIFIFLKELKASTFDARKRFQFAILCVRAMVRISRLRYTPEPLSMSYSRGDPYRIKILRKVL